MSLESSVSFWDELSFWLITAGVILTFIGAGASIMFRRYNRQLVRQTESRNQQERAINQRAIADAGERAAQANERATEAEARAAEANLELAKFKAPRTLTPEQAKQVTDAVKSFVGTHFAIAVFNDPESIALLAQIEQALDSAGWIEAAWKGGDIAFNRAGRPNAGLTSVQGFFVQADIVHDSQFRAPVVALASVLSREGIPAKGEIGKMPPNTNNDVVQILVGKK